MTTEHREIIQIDLSKDEFRVMATCVAVGMSMLSNDLEGVVTGAMLLEGERSTLEEPMRSLGKRVGMILKEQTIEMIKRA